MSTHDYVLANQVGSDARADLNLLFQAIVSQNSSATEPATMYPYMLWFDTSVGYLKQRNAANSAWEGISIAPATAAGHAVRYDQLRVSSTWTPTFSAGLTGTPAITGSYSQIAEKTYQIDITITGTTACAAGTTFTNPANPSYFSTGLIVGAGGVILSGLIVFTGANPVIIGSGWASSSDIKVISYIMRTT